MATAREKALNRARVAKHTKRKKEQRERTLDMVHEVMQHLRREPINTDGGEFIGYAYRVVGDADFEERFKAFAADHGRSVQQLLDEVMVVYFEELQRLTDEQN